MEIFLDISILLVVLSIVIFRKYLFSYSSEKGKNLATKEDIEDITNKIESVKNVYAKEIAKLNVHESYLHKKRVEVIENIYKQMIDAEFSLQQFLVNWWHYSNNESSTDIFSKERGMQFCEQYTEINALLYKNALYFDDNFITEINEVYEPFFNLILDFDESNIPKFPNEFKDIITTGQVPRLSVINLFRKRLGVES